MGKLYMTVTDTPDVKPCNLEKRHRYFGFRDGGRKKKYIFYVLLTVHLRIILVNNQLDSPFFFHVCLFLFSTYFGQPCPHHQEN